jgi:hypothetical protein
MSMPADDDDQPEIASAPPEPAPAILREAWDAFVRDYYALEQEHGGEWVAYHGSRRLGFARTKTELYQECFRQGLKRGEFLVCRIAPDYGDELYFNPTVID